MSFNEWFIFRKCKLLDAEVGIFRENWVSSAAAVPYLFVTKPLLIFRHAAKLQPSRHVKHIIEYLYYGLDESKTIVSSNYIFVSAFSHASHQGILVLSKAQWSRFGAILWFLWPICILDVHRSAVWNSTLNWTILYENPVVQIKIMSMLSIHIRSLKGQYDACTICF